MIGALVFFLSVFPPGDPQACAYVMGVVAFFVELAVGVPDVVKTVEVVFVKVFFCDFVAQIVPVGLGAVTGAFFELHGEAFLTIFMPLDVGAFDLPGRRPKVKFFFEYCIVV